MEKQKWSFPECLFSTDEALLSSEDLFIQSNYNGIIKFKIVSIVFVSI